MTPGTMRFAAVGLVVAIHPACGESPVATGELAMERIAVAGHSYLVRDPHDVAVWTVKRRDTGEHEEPAFRLSLGDHAGVVEVGVGLHHDCARFADGRVKCWGRNEFGSLGLGDTVAREDRMKWGAELPYVDLGTDARAVALSVTSDRTCVVLDSGQIKCWGDAACGVLGGPDDADIGDEPGEMGDALAPIDLGSDAFAVDVSLEGCTACAVLDDATLKCWGANNWGQLGLADWRERYVGDESGELGDSLPRVDLGEGARVIDVATGGEHTCAVLEGGGVKCWGRAGIRVCDYDPDYPCDTENLDYGAGGRLGYGDRRNRGSLPDDMGDNLPLVDLGPGASAIAIQTSTDRTCAVLDDFSVKCWGMGEDGRNGNGYYGDVGDQPGEMGENLVAVNVGTGRSIRALGLSFVSACALLDDETVKCWGGGYGGWHTDELGDALPRIELPP